MKINLLPKKEIKNKAFKLINIVSMTALIFNMSMVGVFITPKSVSAVISGEGPAIINNNSESNQDSMQLNLNAAENNSQMQTITSTHSLSVQKTDTPDYPDPFYSTTKTAYKITVNNIGSYNEQNVTSTDVLPTGLTFVSGDSGVSASGQTVTINFGTINQGQSKSKNFTVLGTNNTINDITVTNNITVTAQSGASANTSQNTTIKPIAPNPALGQSCGLDIGLIIDVSGSVDSTEMSQMKSALTNFVNAFTGTPTVFSITKFSTTASIVSGFSLTPAQAVAIINDSSKIPNQGNGWTNWNDAFIKSNSTFDPRPAKQNLMIIATDGSPNVWGNPAQQSNDYWKFGLMYGIDQANIIKAAGTRIVAFGIGGDNTDPDYPNVDYKLKAITGPVIAPPAPVDVNADVIKTDFNNLGSAMAALASSLCGGKILVQKQIDKNGDGDVTDQGDLDGSTPDSLLADWTFDVNGSPSNPSPKTTTNTGYLEFDVNAGTYSAIETVKSDYNLENAVCVKGTAPVGTFNPATHSVDGINIGTEETVSCNFINSYLYGSVKVNKKVDANGDGTFEGGNSEADTLGFHWGLDGATPDRNMGTIVNNILPGSHAVNENSVTNYHFVGWYPTADTQHNCSNPQGNTLPANINVNINQTTEITLCNARDTGSLKVFKYVDAGSATPNQWSFTISSYGTKTPAPGQNYVVFNNLPTGTYNVSESNLPNYHMVSTTCNNVAVNKNTQSECNFHNTHDTGNLTIHKEVDTDGDGDIDLFDPAGWTWDLDNVNTNYPMGSTQNVLTGNHTVKEDQHANYHSTGWRCTNQTSGSSETLNVNVSTCGVSCTFTNVRDTGTLTVIKHVVGGNAVALNWTMHIKFDNSDVYTFPGAESPGVTKTLTTGTYKVEESNGPADYTLAYSGDCDASGNVTITKDQNKTCVLTNTRDRGTLIVKKHVINDNGGTLTAGNFTMNVSGGHVSNSSFPGSEAGTTVTLDTGSYNVTESVLQGYADSYSTDCSGTIGKNETKTCTITNNDIQPKLTVTKIVIIVINDNGGTKVVADFPLFVDQTNVVSGVQNGFNAGNHVISETQQSGYAGTIGGDCNSQGNITLNPGDVKACTITNNDETAHLKLVKDLITDNGGNNIPSDWTLSASGPTPISGPGMVESDVNAGTYILSENGPSGYQASNWYCEGDGNLNGDQLTLEVGQSAICTITNNDIPGTITGYKYDNNENKLNGWEICWVRQIEMLDFHTDLNTIRTMALNGSIPTENCVFTGPSQEHPDWLNGYYEFTGLYMGTYNLSETMQDGWEAVNPESGEYTDIEITPGANLSYDFVNHRIYSDLTVTKDDGKTTANPGETLTYTITYTNNGDRDAADVTVVDTLPDFVTYFSDTSGVVPTVLDKTYTWLMPGLAKGASNSFIVTVVINSVMPFGTTNLHNVVNVSTTTEELNTENNSAYDDTSVSAAPILALTKTAPAKVNAGDNIAYTINWSVTGNAQATQVVLWDFIPTNTTFTSADNGGTYDAATNKVTWNLGTKNPGDSGTITMVVKTNSPLADGTIITNIAYLDSFETDPALQAQAQTEIVSGPILNITKLDTPDPVKPGDNINYTINWSISGNDTATNVKIMDVIPTNTTYVSVADSGTYDAITNTITWNLGTKNPGDSGSVHFIVKVNSPLANGTVIKNTAIIDSDQTEPTSANAETTVISAPVLTITKSVDKTFVNPGQTANYTVIIENTGNDTAYNVKLTDLLPSGFTFTEFGTSSHTWNLGNLAAGAKISITYNITIGTTVAAGTLYNLAVVSANNNPNATAKTPLEVRVPKVLGEEAMPNLTIEKSVNVSFTNPGNTVKYTVKITNKGDATAVNVQLQDVLPAGLTFAGSTDITKIWKLGDIKVGETKIVTYEVKLDEKILAGIYENIAVAWADNNDKVSDSVALEARPIKVLAETGPAPLDYLYFFGAGSILLTSLYVLRLTNRKKEK